MRFYDEKLEEVHKELYSSAKGLSSAEARARLQRYGYNALKEKKQISAYKIFISQFASPLIWILIVAVIISAFLDKKADAIVIAAILAINAVLGFLQEYRAEKAIEALRKLISVKAKVIRDGREIEIDAKELVPGDIIILETGDRVPADARLIEEFSLETQEASLTGESTPVAKDIAVLKTETQLADRTNMVFSSTLVTKGRAKAIITATGMSAEIGRIAGLIQSTPIEPTPLQKRMRSLSKWITGIIVLLAALVFAAGVLRENIPIEAMFLNAISLAVAVVPEGLPAVVTITLALGVQRMIRRNALMRRLPAVETLGSCTVICTDKTGTLTENQMTVRKLFVNNEVVEVSGAGYSTQGNFSADPKKFDMLLRIGALCNNTRLENGSVVGDPTEAALIVSAAKAGLLKDQIELDATRLEELPFTPQRKLMTAINKTDKGIYAFTKGAPEILLRRCTYLLVNGRERRLTKQDVEHIQKKNIEFADQALRVLGFAYKKMRSSDKDPESQMVFVGLQGMMDPPRPEAKLAIQRCKTAGIRVVMITGDHRATAVAVAKELGIEGKAVLGEDIDKIDIDQEVENISIYARVDPEHKIKIIDALKKRGHIVAMTGDGVNDAPALKRADIGIAMGITGTDAAKEASDMILTDDNFASIVNAVEEGRGVYDNIRKFFAYLFSGNLAELLVVAIALFAGLQLPLTAAMILMINLVTDGLPAIALGADPFEPNAMLRKPRNPKEKIYQGISAYIFWYPLIVTAATLLLFTLSVRSGDTLAKSQTIAFFTIVMFELFQAYSCRSTRYPAMKVGLFKNKYLLLATMLSFAISLAIIYIPYLSSVFNTAALTSKELFISIAIALSGFAFIEIYKFIKSDREVLNHG